jgi:ubiquinone/menaquinone biosynthesis C-methylase UbiE
MNKIITIKNLSLIRPKNIYTGLTLVESHLLKKQYDNIYVENFDKTSFVNLSFDRILFIESFSHSFNKYNTLKEVNRLLKPNGLCFILDLSVTNEFFRECGVNNQARQKYKEHINFFGDKPICYDYMKKIILKSGFKFIKGAENLHNICSIKNTLLNNAIEKIILTKKLNTFYNWYLFKKI